MINDYFTILRSEATDNLSGVVSIRLNAHSIIYEGHFPGEPVSPGVCNIEMIRECAEAVHGHALRINRIKQCRLTTLVTPLNHSTADVTINLQEQEPNTYRLTATLGKGEETYLTLKADVADE